MAADVAGADDVGVGGEPQVMFNVSIVPSPSAWCCETVSKRSVLPSPWTRLILPDAAQVKPFASTFPVYVEGVPGVMPIEQPAATTPAAKCEAGKPQSGQNACASALLSDV